MKKISKKIISAILTLVVVISSTTLTNAASTRVVYSDAVLDNTVSNNIVSPASTSSTNIAAYRDWEFTWRSAPEPIVLTEDIDTISMFGTCVGDEIDENVACHIVDLTYGLYDSILYFPANGSVTTIARELPAGEYRVYFTGDSNIEKEVATVVFTVLN